MGPNPTPVSLDDLARFSVDTAGQLLWDGHPLVVNADPWTRFGAVGGFLVGLIGLTRISHSLE
jgi:hypothetical protein